MGRWKFGRRVKRDKRLRALIQRVEWSARMAGCPSSVLSRVRWRFWESIDATDYLCHGATDWRYGKVWIDVAVDGEEEDTAVHEIAHAAHQQGEKDATGEWLNDHDVIWEAWYDAIGRHYWDDERGPPMPEA